MESSSNIDKEFDKLKNERVYLEPAKKLKEKLQPIKSNVENYAKRWFWELLQNACDYNENAKIRLTIDNEKVMFEHNGKPFTINDALNLIYPYSDKDDDSTDDSIGQFGTGFISTHILSSKIMVKGKLRLEDKSLNDFCFNLNRKDYEDKIYIAQQLQISEEEFRKSIVPSTESESYSTSFTYFRKDEYDYVKGHNIVKIGLGFMVNILPYVFAFNDNLKEVKVITGGKHRTYKSQINGQSVITNYLKTEASGNLIETNSVEVLRLIENDTVVACIIDGESVMSLNQNVPKLFCAFPILDSHEFPFPIIVHSRSFQPTTERVGIHLSINDTKNRNIIEDAVLAYEKLIVFLSDSGRNSLYHLCAITQPNFKVEQIDAWYKQSVIDKLKQIVEHKIQVITNNGPKLLKEIFIPYYKNTEFSEKFYSLCERSIRSFPNQEESECWNLVLDFRTFQDRKYDLERMLKDLSQFSPKGTFLNEKSDVFLWLKDIVEYILITKNKQYLEEHALITDKSNFTHSSKTDLYWDDEIPDDLIDIYDLFTGKDYKKKLIRDILEPLGESLWPLDRKKSEKDISKEIDDFLLAFDEKEYSNDFLEGLKKLFNWTDNVNSNELFPWFEGHKAVLMLNTLKSENDRSMAFDFLRSDKREILSKLVSSNISKESLEYIVNNQAAFEAFTKWKNSKVDDTNASLELGDIGESVVHGLLKKRFQDDSNVEIIWSAKLGEARYDFEIKRNGVSWIYIDAKTTNQGIDNSDSIPFFMRKAQWDFLPNLKNNEMYLIARVFFSESNTSVKWLKLKDENI